MPDANAQFFKAVNSSNYLQKRHAKLVDQVRREAMALGIHLSDEDIAGSTSFRIATYSNNEVEIGEVLAELESVPAVIEYKTLQNLLGRLAEGDLDAVDELPGDPADKLTFARENGLTGKAETDRKLNDAEIAQIKNPADKIAAYRAKTNHETKELEQDERYMTPSMKIAKWRKDHQEGKL